VKFALFGLHRGTSIQPDTMVREAKLAEESGFEAIWVGDHVALPRDLGDAAQVPRLEALVALSYMAAVTTRVRLGAGVIVLPQRQPVLLAKQLTSIDVLSKGRLTVGIGVGYVDAELRALGASLADRGARTDEYLAALHATREALDERHSPAGESPTPKGQPGSVHQAELLDGVGPLDGVDWLDQVEPVTMVQAFVAMAETALEHRPELGPFGRRPEIVVHVDVDVLTTAEPQGATTPDGAGERLRTCRVQDGPGITARVARELACDGGIVLAVRGAQRNEQCLGGPAQQCLGGPARQYLGGQVLGGQVLDIGRRSRRPECGHHAGTVDTRSGLRPPGVSAATGACMPITSCIGLTVV